jgi:GNAT superfamily N-acetyltransferase
MKQNVQYKSGKLLSYAEYGNRDGFPIFIQHGMIASINDYHLFNQLIDLGTRLICIARSVKSFNGKPGKLSMNTSHILTKCVPSSAELQFMEDQLYEFNTVQTGKDDGQLFAFFVRNEQQEIVAGLSGWTWAQACEIQTLWVHPAWRTQGYGRDLLEAAEQEARARGCNVILISSYSFQAPAFYQKHGYELAWQLNDFPPGHQHCFLVKRFT